jgi:UDP-N-acetylglucosamine enolpyruvyl transferase
MEGLYHLDYGYENIGDKLLQLGAKLGRVKYRFESTLGLR